MTNYRELPRKEVKQKGNVFTYPSTRGKERLGSVRDRRAAGWCGKAIICALPHPKEAEGEALLLHLNPSESHAGHGLCPADTQTLQARGRLLQQQVWKDTCQGVRLPSCNYGAIARPPAKGACLQDGGTPNEGLRGNFCWKSEQSRERRDAIKDQ